MTVTEAAPCRDDARLPGAGARWDVPWRAPGDVGADHGVIGGPDMDAGRAAAARVRRAVRALADGRVVVVLDDEDREDEADLIMAAGRATPAAVAFFLEHTSGLLCVAVTPGSAARLDLPPMVARNTETQGTAFLVSVDARTGTTTGISAGDRAATCRALAAPTSTAADLARPGHVLPLLSRPGGVLERRGHTEAGTDLCDLAGVEPAALLCELVTPDRTGMLRGDAALDFARRHGLPWVRIAELVGYRRTRGGPTTCTPERVESIQPTGEARIPIDVSGSPVEFTARAFRGDDGSEHLVLSLGTVSDERPVPVRVHSECLTGDVLGSLRCDCGTQLTTSLEHIAQEGRGALIYLRGHEGRGIGLGHKLQAYRLQSQAGLDTVDANTALGLPVDARDYGAAAQMLRAIGVHRVRLITNNPDKQRALIELGVEVVGCDTLPTRATQQNLGYLSTKRDRLGHAITLAVTNRESVRS